MPLAALAGLVWILTRSLRAATGSLRRGPS